MQVVQCCAQAAFLVALCVALRVLFFRLELSHDSVPSCFSWLWATTASLVRDVATHYDGRADAFYQQFALAALARPNLTTWLSPCQECRFVSPPPVARGVHCQPSCDSRMLDSRGIVALFMVGLRTRLVIDRTLKHVVSFLGKESNYSVHIYASLVERAAVSHSAFRTARMVEHPDFKGLESTEFRRRFGEKVRKAGGCVRQFLTPLQEVLPEIPRSRDYDRQMCQIPPHETRLGRNVLRLWKAREVLWRTATLHEQEMCANYSLVMWLRPDTVWFGDIPDPARLLRDADASRSVWTKDCRTSFGINDKAVLLGRDAARVMLTAYTAWFDPTVSYPSLNPEMFLYKLAKSQALSLKTLSRNSDLQFADGVNTEKGVCLLSVCEELEDCSRQKYLRLCKCIGKFWFTGEGKAEGESESTLSGRLGCDKLGGLAEDTDEPMLEVKPELNVPR